MKFKTVRKIPVVAVTAYTDVSTRVKAEKVGIAGVITKPVCVDKINKCLEEFFFK